MTKSFQQLKGRGLGTPKKSPAKKFNVSRRRSVNLSTSTAMKSSAPSANIRVAVRVRPENSRELAGGHRNVINVVDSNMLVFDPKEDDDVFFSHRKPSKFRDLNKKGNKDKKFTFDVVFNPNSANTEVFEGTTKGLVDTVFQGYNCSVFAYGATGSGKTHTMVGSKENPGITYLTLKEIFERKDSLSGEIVCDIGISYLEVYNEMIRDLLNPGKFLNIREDSKQSTIIPGLSLQKPKNPEEVLSLLSYGNGNRTQHPTDANKESSRSHAVLQVFIQQKNRDAGLSAEVKIAKLSMIDLAGSEKACVSGSNGTRLREGRNINTSLLALGNCINALAAGSKHVPYRDSKLTRLLKDSIGGNCGTVMIANVSPSSETFEDTFNTLKYADRAKKIKIDLKKNVVNVDYHVAQYAKIVEDLKGEIASLKDKNSALEKENEELKLQIQDQEQIERSPAVMIESAPVTMKSSPDVPMKLESKEVDPAYTKLLENHNTLLEKYREERALLNTLMLRGYFKQHQVKRAENISLTQNDKDKSSYKATRTVESFQKKIDRKKEQVAALEKELQVNKSNLDAFTANNKIVTDAMEVAKLKVDLSEAEFDTDLLRDIVKTVGEELEKVYEDEEKIILHLAKHEKLLRAQGSLTNEDKTNYENLQNLVTENRQISWDHTLDTSVDMDGSVSFFKQLSEWKLPRLSPFVRPTSRNRRTLFPMEEEENNADEDDMESISQIKDPSTIMMTPVYKFPRTTLQLDRSKTLDAHKLTFDDTAGLVPKSVILKNPEDDSEGDVIPPTPQMPKLTRENSGGKSTSNSTNNTSFVATPLSADKETGATMLDSTITISKDPLPSEDVTPKRPHPNSDDQVAAKKQKLDVVKGSLVWNTHRHDLEGAQNVDPLLETPVPKSNKRTGHEDSESEEADNIPITPITIKKAAVAEDVSTGDLNSTVVLTDALSSQCDIAPADSEEDDLPADGNATFVFDQTSQRSQSDDLLKPGGQVKASIIHGGPALPLDVTVDMEVDPTIDLNDISVITGPKTDQKVVAKLKTSISPVRAGLGMQPIGISKRRTPSPLRESTLLDIKSRGASTVLDFGQKPTNKPNKPRYPPLQRSNSRRLGVAPPQPSTQEAPKRGLSRPHSTTSLLRPESGKQLSRNGPPMSRENLNRAPSPVESSTRDKPNYMQATASSSIRSDVAKRRDAQEHARGRKLFESREASPGKGSAAAAPNAANINKPRRIKSTTLLRPFNK